MPASSTLDMFGSPAKSPIAPFSTRCAPPIRGPSSLMPTLNLRRGWAPTSAGARGFRRRCWTSNGELSEKAPARRFAACPVRTDRDRLYRSGRSKTARRQRVLSTRTTWWSKRATAASSRVAVTGVINVGGLKVHPEEVEQVINEQQRGPHVARQRPTQSDHG